MAVANSLEEFSLKSSSLRSEEAFPYLRVVRIFEFLVTARAHSSSPASFRGRTWGVQPRGNLLRAEVFGVPVREAPTFEEFSESQKIAVVVVVSKVLLEPGEAGRHDVRDDVVPSRVRTRQFEKLVQVWAEVHMEPERFRLDINEECPFLEVVLLPEREQMEDGRPQLDHMS